MTACCIITVDIDWASDAMLSDCMTLLDAQGAYAHFFATHSTPLLDEIRRHPRFSLGIHPNFLAGSTHGDTLAAVMDTMMQLVPEATTMRTHSLYQSSRLFELVISRYPQITADFSLLTPYARHAEQFLFYAEAGTLARYPYIWEDDTALLMPAQERFDIPRITSLQGVKILNFHPVHTFLNSAAPGDYAALSASVSVREVTASHAERFRNCTQFGIRDFLRTLLQEVTTIPMQEVLP